MAVITFVVLLGSGGTREENRQALCVGVLEKVVKGSTVTLLLGAWFAGRISCQSAWELGRKKILVIRNGEQRAVCCFTRKVQNHLLTNSSFYMAAGGISLFTFEVK